MLPTVGHGERVVIVSMPPGEIECGAIVLFVADGRTILHRVIYKEWVDGEVMFLTRGDNCQTLDNWVVPARAILGVAKLDDGATGGA
jgi:signal peptidase I